MKTVPFVLLCILFSCTNEPESKVEAITVKKSTIFTAYSDTPNEYINFNSVDAIKKIAEINEKLFASSHRRKQSFSQLWLTPA